MTDYKAVLFGYFEHGQEAALIFFHSGTHIRFYDSGQVFAQDRFLRPVAGVSYCNLLFSNAS